MDNASNNETMMKELEQLLLARDIPFDAADRRIMCFSHVVDLSSGRIIRALSSDPLDPIGHARKAVHAIRGSGMRRDGFEEVIVNGNIKGWFKIIGPPPQTIQVQPLQLLRDVQTRWDSEYQMLNRIRELRPVCHLNTDSVWGTLTFHGYQQAVDYFLALPNNSDLEKYKLVSPVWQRMQDVEMVLSVSHNSQSSLKMCSESCFILIHHTGSSPCPANHVIRDNSYSIRCYPCF